MQVAVGDLRAGDSHPFHEGGNRTLRDTLFTRHATRSLVLILATGCGGDAATPMESEVGTPSSVVIPFEIELVFIDNGTAAQNAALHAAADRWMKIVSEDVSDVDFSLGTPFGADKCVEGQPAVSDTIDDVRIYVRIIAIDGAGGTLAQAGPCAIRDVTGIPVLGSMELDQADLEKLEQDGDMLEVVLHEMGHVLGIGTIWSSDLAGLLVNPSLPSSPGADTHFSGPLAIAAFDAAGGVSYTGGSKVPVENNAEEGSSDGHWRETELETELMTPILDVAMSNPLSAITIQSLADVGYGVDVSQADAFSTPSMAPTLSPAVRSRLVDLSGDIRIGAIAVVDRRGRIIEVRR